MRPEIRKDIFGYFDDASQTKPAHDPGMETICPFCGKNLQRPVMTISLMKDADPRSYFYRAHKNCYQYADAETVTSIESALIDNIPDKYESHQEINSDLPLLP